MRAKCSSFVQVLVLKEDVDSVSQSKYELQIKSVCMYEHTNHGKRLSKFGNQIKYKSHFGFFYSIQFMNNVFKVGGGAFY